MLVWINESYYSLFLICVYSKSLTITFLANMAKALVFYLICEFAVIYCIHMTPLPKITARFEKYGHFYIVCIIFHVLLGWSHKSILACQILHRTHCAVQWFSTFFCPTGQLATSGCKREPATRGVMKIFFFVFGTFSVSSSL